MPSRVLVHLPDPRLPEVVQTPERRPARGEEFPPGWTVADYNLARGDLDGQEFEYEVWVVPRIDEIPSSLAHMN